MTDDTPATTPDRDRDRDRRRHHLCGAVLAVLAAAMGWCAAAPEHRVGVVSLFAVACVVYLVGWHGAGRRGADIATRTVLLWAVLCRAVLLPLGPSLSDDAYRYVWDGLVQVEGFNPYEHAPAAPELESLRASPVYDELNSKDYHSVYPPVSQVLFLAGGLLHPLGWEASYYAIKLLLVGLELLGVLLLARAVAARALLLYAWNPLVLVETAGQAHTESAMVLFLLVACIAVQRRRGNLAVGAVTLAAWTKLYPVLLLPFVLRRVGWSRAWVAVVVSLAVVLPYYRPGVVGNVLDSLQLYVRLFEFNAGVYYAVKEIAYLFPNAYGAEKVIGPAFGALCLLAVPVVHWLDRRHGWPLARVVTTMLGTWLVLATTIHPWYFLGVVAMFPLAGRPSWPWLWAASAAPATYLLYSHGVYWPFVWATWVGFAALAAWCWVPRGRVGQNAWIDRVARRRARRKARWLLPHLPDGAAAHGILDLGAGEGYVGAALRERAGCDVVLADVVTFPRVPLPFVRYDGERLPFRDRAFGAVVLAYVLHHCERPERVVREALRVAGRRVLILESVYEGTWDHRLLRWCDPLANRLRSGGRMRAQEEHLRFRTASDWYAAFEACGARVVARSQWGSFLHRQALFVLEPAVTDSE